MWSTTSFLGANEKLDLTATSELIETARGDKTLSVAYDMCFTNPSDSAAKADNDDFFEKPIGFVLNINNQVKTMLLQNNHAKPTLA